MATLVSAFVVVVSIGVVVGLVFNGYGRTWVSHQVPDAPGAGDVTFGLVGIAGSFMGYHIGGIMDSHR